MFSDYNATLYNLVKKEGKVTYKRTYLYGIDWQSETGIKILKTSNTALDPKATISVFIPYESTDKTYLSPKKFNELTNHEKFFTLKAHDKLVKGIIDFEVNNVNDFKLLETKYDDVVTVATVINSEIMGHFEVDCV